MNFISVVYRNRGDGLLIGAKMTQRQLHQQTPPPHGRQFTKSGNLENTAQPVGSSTCWKVSFPDGSVGPNLFQAALLFSVSPKHSCGLVFFWQSLQFICPGRSGLENLGSFRGFLVLCCIELCTSCLTKPPCSVSPFPLEHPCRFSRL